MSHPHILHALITAVIIFSSCSKNTHSCLSQPSAAVHIDLYTAIPSQSPAIQGYVVREGTGAGYGGVVIVPSYMPDEYRAFELSAPHLPRAENTVLTVSDDGMRAVCPADGSEFMLCNGMPLSSGKKISPCGLIEYTVMYDPVTGIIRVRN